MTDSPHQVGWPMALALGNANSVTEFVSPTSEEVGHPPATAGKSCGKSSVVRIRWTQDTRA